MIKTLKDTTTSDIQAAVTEARQRLGATSGLVFTLCVVADLRDFTSVLASCIEAGREHPSRIILVTDGTAKADRLDAEVHLGEDVPGEIIILRFQGELQHHRETVVLPLLLPDSPVLAWWPGTAPASLAEDPVGSLASRRISDSMRAADPIGALAVRAANLAAGDTDLTWTRLTPWRALLAASLDQIPAKVARVVVGAEQGNAAGVLLAAWLDDRLRCEVITEPTAGPGITSVVMTTHAGNISITRQDGKVAAFTAPDTPSRTVVLRRRSTSQLITEELRRLDADDILASAMARLLTREGHPDAGVARPEQRPARALARGKRGQAE